MKRTMNMVTAIALVAGFGFLAGCGSGCKTAQGQYNPATGVYDTNVVADTIVVTAQNTRDIALQAFDAIMTIEAHNEAALKAVNPAIHDAAENVRKNSKGWLNELTAAIKDYQSDRSSSANWTKLSATLKVVEDALLSATTHLAEATKAVSKGTP